MGHNSWTDHNQTWNSELCILCCKSVFFQSMLSCLGPSWADGVAYVQTHLSSCQCVPDALRERRERLHGSQPNNITADMKTFALQPFPWDGAAWKRRHVRFTGAWISCRISWYPLVTDARLASGHFGNMKISESHCSRCLLSDPRSGWCSPVMFSSAVSHIVAQHKWDVYMHTDNNQKSVFWNATK